MPRKPANCMRMMLLGRRSSPESVSPAMRR
jgi:hypothetical protein